MSFWLVPLLAKLGYATSINWKWHFTSWSQILPSNLWPVAILAALDVIWILVRRRPEDRPARYLAVSAVLTVICFLNSTEVGLPEIRFVPFVYVLLIFLAVDFLRRVLLLEFHRWPRSLPLSLAPHVGAIALSLCFGGWAYAHTSFIPSWIKWNYEGLEKKTPYPLLRGISEAVKGSISDPRVVYENSPKHDRFGSMRVFEDLALFSGRATLEGVLLQTAVNSPFIYWIQSLVSKQGTGVIPGYSYPQFNLTRAMPRLDLFNVHDMIALTPEAKTALAENPRWERIFSEQQYEVFHLKDADRHYVRVPRFQPVLLESKQWKQDFHRWFSNDTLLDIPLVEASRVPRTERARFPLVSSSPTELPREPIDATCEIEEKIDHLAIEFTTSCPGLPHRIAVSYFPNWHVEGASQIFLVSPAFMLVFPDGPQVRLSFRRNAIDWLGVGLSLLGLGLCVVRPRRAEVAAEPAGATARALAAAHPALLALSLGAVAVLTAWHVARDMGPDYFYGRGWEAFEAGEYAESQRGFELALWLGGDSVTAGNAAFFRAASLLRAGKPGAALEGYESVIRDFPNSIWVAESHYHVGLCLRQLERPREAAERFEFVITNYPGNRWAGFAAEQLEQVRRELQGPAAEPDA
jgi:hypothetical protein